jgi:carbon monoxide dehydrogenase subunit G
MPQFHTTVTVSASPEKAWAALGNLAAVDQWIPGITEVKVEGQSVRVCTLANGAVQHETISDYSPETRSYRYHIEGSPLPVTNNRGRFAVEADSGETVIVCDSAFDVLDPAHEAQVSALWGGAIQGALESLKKLIERA